MKIVYVRRNRINEYYYALWEIEDGIYTYKNTIGDGEMAKEIAKEIRNNDIVFTSDEIPHNAKFKENADKIYTDIYTKEYIARKLTQEELERLKDLYHAELKKGNER